MRVLVAQLTLFQRGLIFRQLQADHPNRFFFGGGAQQAQQVVPAAKFRDEPYVLLRGLGPGKGHVAKQGAEQGAFAHAAANVPQMEQQLCRQLRGFDVRPVEQIDLVAALAVAHPARHGEEIQAGVAGAAVGLGPVQGTGVIRLCFQVFKIAHILFPPFLRADGISAAARTRDF